MKTKIGLVVLVLVLGLVFVACDDLLGADDDDDDDAGRGALGSDESVAVYDISPGWNLSVANDGRIWTNNGIGIAVYDYESNQWTQYNADDVDAIREPDQGRVHVSGDDVWIAYGWAGGGGDGEGVTRWNPVTDTYSHFLYGSTEGFPRGPVWTVSEDPDGNIWVGTRWEVGAAYYDGNDWTQVKIEGLTESDGRYFDCNTVRHDDEGNTYFSTWRGGLHIKDSSGNWVHTEKGAVGGTESFLSRGVYSTDFDFTSDGSIVYVATRNWSHDGIPNESVGEPDGVWKYESDEWTSLTDGVGEAIGAVLDTRGYLWSTFTTDYWLRYYDGEEWSVVELEAYQPSASDFVTPVIVDGEYMWLVRNRTGETSQIVRYKYK